MSVLAHIVRKDGVVSCLSKILMQCSLRGVDTLTHCSLRGVDTLTHCSLRGVDTLTHFSLRGVDAMLSRLVKYRLAALRITCPAGNLPFRICSEGLKRHKTN